MTRTDFRQRRFWGVRGVCPNRPHQPPRSWSWSESRKRRTMIDIEKLHVTRKTVRRFQEKVTVRPDGCWDWKGGTHHKRTGHGLFHIGSTRVRAYSFSYYLATDTCPVDRMFHHLCERPLCVNPAHVTPITDRHHRQIHHCFITPPHARINGLKTRCKRGHDFDQSNTISYIYQGHARRQCRTCHNEWRKYSRQCTTCGCIT